MVKCSAYKCNSATYNKTPGLSFHRFPKDSNLKKVWVQNMNCPDWQPSSSHVLCSKHFEAHLKDTSAFCTILRPGAIPTLFEENSENEEKSLKAIAKKIYETCASGNFVSSLRDVQITPEPQPCSSTHKDSSPDYSGTIKNEKENFAISESSRQECASGGFTSVLQKVQNIPKQQPYLSARSDMAVQTKNTVEDHETVSSKFEKLKRKIASKNKKIKILQQKTRRLQSKVSHFSDIIRDLKKKICKDDALILSSIPVSNKDLFIPILKKKKVRH